MLLPRTYIIPFNIKKCYYLFNDKKRAQKVWSKDLKYEKVFRLSSQTPMLYLFYIKIDVLTFLVSVKELTQLFLFILNLLEVSQSEIVLNSKLRLRLCCRYVCFVNQLYLTFAKLSTFKLVQFKLTHFYTLEKLINI